jgi:myosin V
MVAERKENEVTKNSHANALVQNEELNKKVKDADEKIKQFNDIVQRFAAQSL